MKVTVALQSTLDLRRLSKRFRYVAQARRIAAGGILKRAFHRIIVARAATSIPDTRFQVPDSNLVAGSL